MKKLPAAVAATTLATLATLSACGSTPTYSSTPPPGAPSTTAVDAATTRPVALGPTGYGQLALGSGYKVAMATGLVAHGSRGSHLTGHPDAGLCLNRTDGLMAIFLGKGMRTSEGLRIGDSAARLRAAYPDLRPYGVSEGIRGSGIFRADAADGDWYEIDLDHGSVSVVILRQDHQTCFE